MNDRLSMTLLFENANSWRGLAAGRVWYFLRSISLTDSRMFSESHQRAIYWVGTTGSQIKVSRKCLRDECGLSGSICLLLLEPHFDFWGIGGIATNKQKMGLPHCPKGFFDRTLISKSMLAVPQMNLN